MQAKNRSSFVCSVHVGCYALPFIIIVCFGGFPVWALAAILAQHWTQDRFGLHLRWMWAYRQTPPDKWPVGPLCIDQSWHLAFIGTISAFC